MRTLRLALIGAVILVLGGLSGAALAQETTDERSELDAQAIAERANEAINGCDVVTCDLAPFEEVYGPDIQLIVDDEVLAEGLDELRLAALHTSNSYRLITPVAEYPSSDGDRYIALWVDVSWPRTPGSLTSRPLRTRVAPTRAATY